MQDILDFKVKIGIMPLSGDLQHLLNTKTKTSNAETFPEHKICLVGLDNAGKTTILYQFLMNEVVHTSPTIGSNVEEVVWNNIHFIMWDLGGQESLRTAWNTYYSNTEFILLVVDSTDRERLSITKEELHKMLQSDELCNASVLVFANKQVKLNKCLLYSIIF